MLVSFDSLAVFEVDASLLELVGAGAGVHAPVAPQVRDSTTNYVCAHNLGCASINTGCGSNIVCDR